VLGRLHALVSIALSLALAVAVSTSAVAHAQIVEPEARPTSTFAGTVSLGGTGTPWGTRMEHWLVAGGALALGAITVAIGTGIDRYAVDLNDRARDPATTQHDAASNASTARDFLISAEVLWSIGAALAGMGLVWVIVLSFSTPTQTAAPEAAAATPSASLRVTPLGLTLEGVF
jgi:hypothetical protein